MKNPLKKEIVILILCLLIGFILRFYTFDQKSLWLDEIYTFNDSRDDLRGHLKWYKENPTFLHPPLFFILTHLFYPFPKPERDLRIIPLIFGTLSIPLIYLLSRLFSPNIALLCTLSLVFMTYHISLSQDGRSYSFLLFLGIAALYFFMKHLITSKRRSLFLVALFFGLSFHTSYSSIPFIVLSQILWFYRPSRNEPQPIKRTFISFLILNGLTLLLCLPWLLFLTLNYNKQPLMDPFHTEDPGSLWNILYGVLHDWVPHAPLMMASAVLLILFPIFSNNRKNGLVLMAFFLLPIVGLFLFCQLFNVTHFVTSRYFINFLPPFLITLYLSLDAIEMKFGRLTRFLRLKLLFVILFIASNLVILPLYYRSEKQDFRGLVNFLKNHLQDRDKVIVGSLSYIPGMLHYFGVTPEGRHYSFSFREISATEKEYRTTLMIKGRKFLISYSKTYWLKYAEEGSRLWIITNTITAKKLERDSSLILKGYFDGSFLNFISFPTDASMVLLFWAPNSSEEEGIDIPVK